jgi:hypothetical protein
MKTTKINAGNLNDCLGWIEKELGAGSVTEIIKGHAEKLVQKDPGVLTGEEVMNLAKRQYTRRIIDARTNYLD